MCFQPVFIPIVSDPAAWPNVSKFNAEVTPVKSKVSWEVRVVGWVVHWTLVLPSGG